MVKGSNKIMGKYANEKFYKHSIFGFGLKIISLQSFLRIFFYFLKMNVLSD
jgi:hypothetical protein